MKKIIVLFAVCAALLSSCIRSEDVVFTGIKNYELLLPSTVNVSFGIENNSSQKLHLLSCNVDLEYREQKVITVILDQPVMVNAHFVGEVPIVFRFRVSDPLAGLSVINSLMNNTPNPLANATVSGEVIIKAGWKKKKIRLQHESLSQFVANFGLSKSI